MIKVSVNSLDTMGMQWALNAVLRDFRPFFSSAYHFIFLWDINEIATKMFKHVRLNS